MADQLKAGEYVLLLSCPECGFTVHFPVELSSRYTNDHKGVKLAPVLTAKSRDHSCGADALQDALPFPTVPDYLQQR